MKNTNRATEFSKDLCNALKSRREFTKRNRIHKWQKNWPIPGSGETVDVVGLGPRERPSILIEAELLREDPASNVVKIWKWAMDSKVRHSFVLVQAFSKIYLKSKKERKERAVFLGSRMAKELRRAQYLPVGFDYNPRPGGKIGAGRRKYHAYRLAHQITKRLSETE
jgi:hypothetical protein